MSYDIYGNPLRRGHCEVHPHIHEEYPCSMCLADAQRRKNPLPPVDYDPLLEISELKIQRDELLAALETSHTVACVLMSRFSSVGMLQEWHQANEMAEKIERAIAKAKGGAA